MYIKLGHLSANIVTIRGLKLCESSLIALVSRYPARVHLRGGDRDLSGDQGRRGIPGYISRAGRHIYHHLLETPHTFNIILTHSQVRTSSKESDTKTNQWKDENNHTITIHSLSTFCCIVFCLPLLLLQHSSTKQNYWLVVCNNIDLRPCVKKGATYIM